jgi:phosphoribosylformimino-5-aminoimidazole carboxamide ribotide isomerase
MILLPAIDLIAGRCVRLAQGDFSRETSYSDDPAAALADFAGAGASEAHLVDLDGARAGAPRQHDLFRALAKTTGLQLQVAGGFRSPEQVAVVLDAGIARVVIGSLALSDPAAFTAMLDRFGPHRLTLALDIRLEDGKPMVATHGWEVGSGRTLAQVLAGFPAVRHVLVTDIARDGMLSGPNVELMTAILAAFPAIVLQASGGVATLDDLATLHRVGAARAIVGKAIWEGRFTVAQGVAHARG